MKTFIQSDIEIRKLGMNIQIARKRRKMTLVELSTKSSVSKTALRRIEEGDVSVGIGKAFNVLDALGLLKRISDIANPDLDRTQALFEIKQLREKTGSGQSHYKGDRSGLIQYESDRFVKTF